MPKPIEDDMAYQSRHTKKRKREALTEETVEAKTSGSGTADPDEMFPEQEKTLNEWKKFMKTSWEEWLLLYMKNHRPRRVDCTECQA